MKWCFLTIKLQARDALREFLVEDMNGAISQ